MRSDFNTSLPQDHTHQIVQKILHLIAIIVLALGWTSHIRSKQSVADVNALLFVIGDQRLSSDDLQSYRDNSENSNEKAALQKLIQSLKGKQTDTDETIQATINLAEEIDNSATFSGILLTFLTAGYVGIVFVIYVLPVIAHRATHTIYDSGEMVEKDMMSEARSKLAQGDYEAAIDAFRKAAEADPGNRLPLLEIIKIQREVFQDPTSAIATISDSLKNVVWPEDDAAFFLFRITELYDEDLGDRDSAAAIMQQVMEQFPETRHSANARQKLIEWGQL